MSFKYLESRVRVEDILDFCSYSCCGTFPEGTNFSNASVLKRREGRHNIRTTYVWHSFFFHLHCKLNMIQLFDLLMHYLFDDYFSKHIITTERYVE